MSSYRNTSIEILNLCDQKDENYCLVNIEIIENRFWYFMLCACLGSI